MARSVALAVDLGASGGRVVSGAFDGRLLELEEIHRFENGPVGMGGQLVWDLPRLWQEVILGLRAAAARHGRSVATIGVDAGDQVVDGGEHQGTHSKSPSSGSAGCGHARRSLRLPVI